LAPKAVGRTVQLGTGSDVSVGEMVEMVGSILGKQLYVTLDETRVRPIASEVQRLISEPRLARTLLEWEPTVGLREGMERTIEWIEQNLFRYRADQYVI
jgi:nucleoside-diphosphate-sugar epimerase